MKKKWDREEDSMSLVITPHEAVIIEMALKTRLRVLNAKVRGYVSTGAKDMYTQDILDIMEMVKIITKLK